MAVTVACASLLAGCGSAGADAPRNASVQDFCDAKRWLVVEGANRFFEQGLPDDEQLTDLIHDWSDELARVGTPENISSEARTGFEKLVERAGDVDEGDVEDRTFNTDGMGGTDGPEKAFSNYVTNTCP